MKQRLLLAALSLVMAGSLRAQLEQDSNGFYLIGTADDLVEFSEMTNDQSEDSNRYLKGRLTADIDLSGVENFTPIGKHTDIDLVTGLSVRDWDWRGTFDGQGHTIRNLTVKTVDGSEGGLFSRIIDATVSNLAIENAHVTCEGGIRAGAMIAIIIRGQVFNCYTCGPLEIETTSKSTGGIAGTYLQNYGALGRPLTSCFTTAETLCGEDSEGEIINCYAGEDVAAMASTGELCYRMNGDQSNILFYQTLGEDAWPTFDSTHKRVYANGDLNCDGSPKDGTQATYDNEMTSVIPPHEYAEDGICVNCGHDSGTFDASGDGWFEVTTPAQLRYISRLVNTGQNNIRVRLMNDLDLAEIEKFPPIGYFDDNGAQISFTGTFDGQKHVIRNLKVDCEDGQECGLFGRVSGGTVVSTGIENASVVSHNGIRCGALGGEIFNANVRDVYVAGEIYISNGEGQKGGLAGEAALTSFHNCWTTYTALAAAMGKPDNSFAGEEGAQLAPTGELCYRLNDGSILRPTWYQTLESDAYPTFDESHGLVYAVGESQYASAMTEADYKDLTAMIVDQETEKWDDAAVTHSLLEAYMAELGNLSQHTTRETFNAAYESLLALQEALKQSMQAYKDYEAKVAQVKKFIEENPNITGPNLDLLKEYLEGNYEAGETFPNGSYSTITENYTLTTEEIIDETAYVQELLDLAIATGYQAGADITNLMTNADFMDKLNGWTLDEGTASVSQSNNSQAGFKRVVVGSQSVDINQTITGLKDGIYQIEIPGFSVLRSITDAHIEGMYNYGGFIYANDMANYIETKFSDMLNEEEVYDKTLVYSSNRFTIYFYNDDEQLGYAPSHAIGVAFARDAGHYRNRILVNVTDGTLKIGVRNNTSLQADNLTYLLRATLTYQGTMESSEAATAMDAVLNDMQSKAAHLVEDYTSDYIEYSDAPNYFKGLNDELTAAIADVTSATTGEQKYALVERFSDIFRRVSESKHAYEQMMITANEVADIYGTYTSPELQAEFQLKADEVLDIFDAGSATTEEVLALIDELQHDPTFLRYHGVEPELVDGYYQIATPGNLVWFSTYVDKGGSDDKYCKANAVLTNDIDLSEIDNFLPIGMHIDTDNEAGVEGRDYAYRGKFDGQGHVIRNLTVERTDYSEVGLFGRLIDADIRNLGIENATMSSDQGVRVGVIAGIILRGNIENCYTIGELNLSTSNKDDEKCGIAGSILSFGGTAVATNLYTTYDVLHAGTQFPPLMNRCYEGEMVFNAGPTGELCYLLNKESSENVVWYQTLGEDEYPVLNPTHSIVIRNDDGTFGNETGITEIPDGKRVNGEWYDLSGRKVNVNGNLPKGIYIIGQKKVLVK